MHIIGYYIDFKSALISLIILNNQNNQWKIDLRHKEDRFGPNNVVNMF